MRVSACTNAEEAQVTSVSMEWALVVVAQHTLSIGAYHRLALVSRGLHKTLLQERTVIAAHLMGISTTQPERIAKRDVVAIRQHVRMLMRSNNRCRECGRRQRIHMRISKGHEIPVCMRCREDPRGFWGTVTRKRIRDCLSQHNCDHLLYRMRRSLGAPAWSAPPHRYLVRNVIAAAPEIRSALLSYE